MMDISDGLASDVQHMTKASGVGAVVYEDQLPISITARQIAEEAGRDPRDLALYGGEDYELLIALPEDAVATADKAMGQLPLYVVGAVLPSDQGVQLERFGGAREPLQPQGWTHF
jgi:thiamine-monophosphate kinase